MHFICPSMVIKTSGLNFHFIGMVEELFLPRSDASVNQHKFDNVLLIFDLSDNCIYVIFPSYHLKKIF